MLHIASTKKLTHILMMLYASSTSKIHQKSIFAPFRMLDGLNNMPDLQCVG